MHHRRRRKPKKNFMLPLLGLLLIGTITAAVCVQLTKAAPHQPDSTQAASEPDTQPTSPSTDATGDTTQPTAEAPTAGGYDYGEPVPQSEAVDNSYFDDAVFIGDSRTEGLILYTGLSNTTVYANQGLMVDTVFTSPVIQMDGQKLSVVEALRRTEFKKVYIMLGINETGWAYESIFIDKYKALVEEIQSINPQAIIYIQEIMPVTAETSRTHSYVKNEKIQRYNELLAKLAEEMGVYYIDTGAAVADASGCLPEEAAIDGIHLKKPYCDKWLDYLKTHTVQPEKGA